MAIKHVELTDEFSHEHLRMEQQEWNKTKTEKEGAYEENSVYGKKCSEHEKKYAQTA